MTRLIPYAGLVAASWKNGGGSSTEIAVSPDGAGFADFDWRVSLATINADGPFSIFDGVDRTLALVDGAGVTLSIDGARRFVLCEDDPLMEFKGEAEVDATLNGGATIDFNIMTRRARCQHRLGRRDIDGRAEFAPRGDLTVLFLAAGESLSVSSDGERLGMVRYDAVVFEGAGAWVLEAAASATVLVADIFYV
jgi:environmental stress-induced protein Ves